VPKPSGKLAAPAAPEEAGSMDPPGIPRYMGLQREPERAGLPRPAGSPEVASPRIPSGLPGIDLPVTRKNPEQWKHPELPDHWDCQLSHLAPAN